MFIDLLIEISEMWNVNIAAYCLMKNHYHILLQTPDGNISRCMRHLNSVYTQRYNRKHGLDGQLFRGRYKSILVCNDSHLLQLVRYIHKNPVKAGLVKDITDYEWSSYKGYLSYAKKWNWLHKDSDNHKRYNRTHNILNILFNSTLTFLIRRCAIQSCLKIQTLDIIDLYFLNYGKLARKKHVLT